MHRMELNSAETGSKCPYLTIWSQMKGVIKGKWQQQKEKKFPELGKTFNPWFEYDAEKINIISDAVIHHYGRTVSLEMYYLIKVQVLLLL